MNDMPSSPVADLAKTGTWIGVGLILLGILFLAAPQQSGIAVATVAGILLFMGGGLRIVFMFFSLSWGSLFWRFLFGLAGVAAGLYMMFNPTAGLEVLTIVTIAYFVVDGLTDVFTGLRFPPGGGGFWFVSSGLFSLLLAFLMYRSWPVSGEVAVPILIGIRMIYSGLIVLIVSRASKAVFGGGN